MEDYPEYRFACSQAQQYAWIKERNPELWGRSARSRRARAVRAGRRQLDRARLQPPVGRVARAPVPPRPALVRARVRPAPPRVLEPRRVRLRRAAAADPARGGDHALPDAEALVEPLQQAGAPHAHVAGRSTAARCSRTSRPPTPTTPRRPSPSCVERARLQGSRALAHEPARVRLRRRRRRARRAT